MTQDELIKCGCWFTDTGTLVTDDIDLNAFAKLVAEKEREACAEIAKWHQDMAAEIKARAYQKGQTD